MSWERDNLSLIKTKENQSQLHLLPSQLSPQAKYRETLSNLTFTACFCFRKSRQEHQRTQNQESWGYSVQSTSYNCQQSNSELSVGRERGKGDVEKGLWADTCSATYGFTPKSQVYFKKSSHRWKLLLASWQHKQQGLLKIWKFFLFSGLGTELPETPKL